jgi:hypothetical protein
MSRTRVGKPARVWLRQMQVLSLEISIHEGESQESVLRRY